MNSKLETNTGKITWNTSKLSNDRKKTQKFPYNLSNSFRIQNYTTYPDGDIEHLRKQFHIQIKKMVFEQDFSHLLEIYEEFNRQSLETNQRNFVPSSRSLLFLLNALRMKKIKDLDIIKDLVWNLIPTDRELVVLKQRLLRLIGILESERNQVSDLNQWISDLVEDL